MLNANAESFVALSAPSQRSAAISVDNSGYDALGNQTGPITAHTTDSPAMAYGEQMRNVARSAAYVAGNVAIGAAKGLDNLIPETAALAYRATGYAAAGVVSLVNTNASDAMFAKYEGVTGRWFSYDNTLQEASGIAAQLAAPMAGPAARMAGAAGEVAVAKDVVLGGSLITPGGGAREVNAAKDVAKAISISSHELAAKGVASGADNAGHVLKLKNQLASQAQMAEAGTIMAGPGGRVAFRDAQRVASEHGGNAADWAKKTSSSFTDGKGTRFETHWVENIKTGQRVEFKTKFPE